MIGKEIAHYRIEVLLGAGGMGEVYQARDTRLGRNVAVKMLPEIFARDADRVARFEREAKVLASLNHANIAALYGMEQADGKHFLVMELVEGETLAERIARGPIAAEEALKIAHQIAEALEAAHEKSVIHRDLKPANVKITPEGKVKVLDFGLAKALEATPMQIASNSPTLLSAAATNAGVILGTAGYMSPEQARGHEADQRSDIFSFGCVLYEMLTGRQTFQGETVTDIIASIVAREPDFRALPANLHPKTQDVIRRCLAKNRKDRWHAIADVRVELETIMADPFGTQLQAERIVQRQPQWRRAIPIVITAAIVAVLAIAGTLAVINRRAAGPIGITRFSFMLPEGQTFLNNARNVVAISPDGSSIVYTSGEQLYIRAMDEMTGRPIPGTSQSPSRPFFSPDGRWVGFMARTDRKVKKIAVTGGAAVTIFELMDQIPYSFNWHTDGQIYIGEPGGVFRVSENGGKPEKIITLKEGEIAADPQMLPDGDHMLFTMGMGAGVDSWDKAQIVIHSLKTGERKVVIDGGTDGRYVPTGHVVYALGSTMLAVPFDAARVQRTGGPVPIIEAVRRAGAAGGGGYDAFFAFSATGSLVYVPGATSADAFTLAVVDRAGNRKILNVAQAAYAAPRASPNGKQLAISMDDGKESAIWIYDLAETSPLRRLTFGGQNRTPVWTRDGQRVVFMSDRDGGEALYWQPTDGSGSAERLFKGEPRTRLQPESWTPDGKTIIFVVNPGTAAGSIWMATPNPDQKAKLLISPAGNPNLSPNGKWLAYHAATRPGGRFDVYVEPFPPTGAKYQITSNGGGGDPLWSPDGKQLFYINSRQIVSVDVQTEPRFELGKPKALPIQGLAGSGPRRYDITPDGKFVIMLAGSQASTGKIPQEQINVTLNWFEELKQRVPVK